MSNNPIDKLFKDGLENKTYSPSQDLWSRIEPQLEAKKKNNFLLYMSIAASLFLIITIGAVYYNPLTFDASQTIAKNTSAQKNNIPDNKDSDETITEATTAEQLAPTEISKVAIEIKSKPINQKSSQQPVASIAVKQNKIDNRNTVKEIKQPLSVDTVKQEASEKIKLEEIINDNATSDANYISTQQKEDKKYVFDISDFENITAEKAEVAEADSKQSKLKEIWEAAKQLKNSDTGIGELRAAKNELLSKELNRIKGGE